MNSASGNPSKFLIPPRLRSSFACSRWKCSASFLDIRSTLPSAITASISFSRLIDCFTVLKLVSMPPSQR